MALLLVSMFVYVDAQIAPGIDVCQY